MDDQTDPSYTGSLLWETSQSICCQNKCNWDILLVLYHLLLQGGCLNLLYNISPGQQWVMQVYWCIWCSQLRSLFSSIAALHGGHHVYRRIPFCLCHWPRASPLPWLLIWLFSETCAVLQVESLFHMQVDSHCWPYGPITDALFDFLMLANSTQKPQIYSIWLLKGSIWPNYQKQILCPVVM